MGTATSGDRITARSAKVSGFAIASLALGIFWMFGLGSLLAVIFGVIARKECDRDTKSGKGMAIAGVILGIVGLSIVTCLCCSAFCWAATSSR